jgi:TetR/AcrR family transcriptional repressor of nem operon
MARPKGYSRDAVIDKAMTYFWRHGYEGAHLAGLVAATGLNRFSLYKEFDGKAGLYQAALTRFLEYLLGHYRTQLLAEPLGLGNIERVLRSLEYGNQYYGCFMINTLTQMDAGPKAAMGLALAGSDEILGLYRDNLQAALAGGELAAGSDVEALAKTIQTIDQGLHVQGLAGTTDAQKDAVIAMVLTMLRRG